MHFCFTFLPVATDGNYIVCPVEGKQTVTPTLDSRRYFVLKINDKASGRHAFMGLGFDDR